LFVRSERTGNSFVANSIRPAFGLGVSPTLYRRFPGLGPWPAIRHSITPSLSYQYTPAGNVSDEYLEAVGSTRIGYLGANRQSMLSLGLSTLFEAKLRPAVDSLPEEQWQKIKLLTLNFTVARMGLRARQGDEEYGPDESHLWIYRALRRASRVRPGHGLVVVPGRSHF
jgi:hypothetical protein